MNAEQIIAAIHGSYATGSKHGFRNTIAMLDACCPQRKVPVIHVAGTNGKGSVCATLESILRHAGFKTGLYTSPFLQAYQERIRLDGLPLSDEVLVKYGEPLVHIAQELQAQDAFVTPFEMGTALALSVFEGEQVDFAIVEVGMGGRMDPTNIVDPILCGITAIGLDHMGFLGDTLEQIAGEKAGIIKEGVPVVCHPATEGVAAVFAEHAAKKHAPLTQLQPDMIRHALCTMHGATATFSLRDEWNDMIIALPGAHQLTNALTVLGMVEALRKQGIALPEEAVRRGMAEVVWPARLEWCGNVLIDGAHNPQGVAALKAFVDAHLSDRRRVLFSGVMADKLQPDMLSLFVSLAHQAVTVTPDNPRSLPAEDYARALEEAGLPAEAADSMEAGFARAKMLAGDDGIVIAAGSLYFAGGLRSVLQLPWR